jgi:hypothetical protein
MRPATRTAEFGESTIREMTRLAIQHDAINLSQGSRPRTMRSLAGRTNTPSPGATRPCVSGWPRSTRTSWAGPSTPTSMSPSPVG